MERSATISRFNFSLSLLWLLMAISSIVFIEPAPYDLLGITLALVFFGLGLRIPVGLGSAGILLGIFLLANLLASALAQDPVDSIRSLAVRTYMIAFWVMFTSLVYEDPKRILNVLFSGYMVAAIIAVTAGILGYYRLVPFTEQLIEFGRVRSLFKDPNVYGPFLVPVALYAIVKLETATISRKIFLAAALGFLVFGILLSFSRGSWLNLAIALFLYFILRVMTQRSSVSRQRMLLHGGAVAALVMLFVGFAISTDSIQSMVERRAKLQYYDLAEEEGRFDRQLIVLKSALVTPIGIGAGQSDKDYNFGKEPHNIYLQVLIEAGWAGALAFYGFILLTLRKSIQFAFQPSEVQPLYIAMLACFAGLLAQSLFVDSTHWRHMYVLLATLWGPFLAWRTDTLNGTWTGR
jgi:O-antigen ligase